MRHHKLTSIKKLFFDFDFKCEKNNTTDDFFVFRNYKDKLSLEIYKLEKIKKQVENSIKITKSLDENLNEKIKIMSLYKTCTELNFFFKDPFLKNLMTYISLKDLYVQQIDIIKNLNFKSDFDLLIFKLNIYLKIYKHICNDFDFFQNQSYNDKLSLNNENYIDKLKSFLSEKNFESTNIEKILHDSFIIVLKKFFDNFSDSVNKDHIFSNSIANFVETFKKYLKQQTSSRLLIENNEINIKILNLLYLKKIINHYSFKDSKTLEIKIKIFTNE